MLETSNYQISHNLNGSITVSYTPVMPGLHKVIIQHEGLMCEGFPLHCSVQKFGDDYITSYETGASEKSDLCALENPAEAEAPPVVKDNPLLDPASCEKALEKDVVESVQLSQNILKSHLVLDEVTPEAQHSDPDLVDSTSGIVEFTSEVVDISPILDKLNQGTLYENPMTKNVMKDDGSSAPQNDLSDEDPPNNLGDQDPPQNDVSDKDLLNDLDDQDPPQNELGDQDPPQNDLGDQDPLQNDLGDQDPPQNDLGDQDPPQNDLGDQDPPQNDLGDQDRPQNDLGDQDPPQNNLGDQDQPSLSMIKRESPDMSDEDQEDSNHVTGSDLDTSDSDHSDAEKQDKIPEPPGSRQVSKIRKSLEKYKLINKKDGAPAFNIDCCGSKFKSFDSLQKHIEVIHNNEKESKQAATSSKRGKKRPASPEGGSATPRPRLKRRAACGKKDVGDTLEEVLDNIDSVHCPLCRKVCISVQCVKKHVKAEHSQDIGPKPKQSRLSELCNLCNKKFSKYYYAKHMEKVHHINAGEEPADGKRCTIKSENKDTPTKLPKAQEDIRQVCPVCGKIYSKGNLRTHIERKHQNRERVFECSEGSCGKKFKLKVDLKRHVLKMHENNSTFICEFCAKVFRKKESVTEHVASVHQEFKPKLCTVEGCSKTFPTVLKLKAHVKNVHGPKESVFCNFEGCGKVLADKHSFRMHMMAHEGYRWVCPEDGCNRQFTQKHVLMRHIASKHRITLDRFTCPRPDCGKKFKFKDSLRAHLRSHATSRNFPCVVCGKRFKTNQMLTSHSRIHNKERQYACEICGKSFPRRYRLIEHITKSHPDVIIQIPV